MIKNLRRILSCGLLILILPGLYSCGGGGDSVASGGVGTGGTGLAGGVGTGGSGFSLGTVLGFGSIVLDGNTYSSATAQYLSAQYSSASVSTTAESAQTSSTALGVGHQVEITLDSSGNPTTVLAVPAVVGAVSAVSGNPTTSFTISNITVRINSDTTHGPVTYFNGLQSAASIAVGQQLEVHGLYYSTAGTPYIQATRISLLKTTNTTSRIVGVISNLSANQFNLGTTVVTTTNATTVPANTTLANGQFVNVWSSAAMSGTSMTANKIRIRQLSTSSGTVKVAGIVYGLSGTSFSVSGVSVDASLSSLQTTLGSLVSGSSYVTVTGQANSSGVLVASALSTSVANVATHEVKGTITNYIDSSNFQVRGVTIDATSATITPSNAVLQNGTYVDVVGAVSHNLLTASTIAVSTAISSGSTVEYIGTISASTANSLTMTTQSGASLVFSLATNVGYENGSQSNLIVGNRICVEGTYNNSGYTAYGISFLNTSGSDTGTPQGKSEVSGKIYGVSSTVSGNSRTYTFSINKTQVQYTVTGTVAGLVEGASADVYFTPGSPNVATSVSLDD
jgi:hypothetical protein